MARNRYMVGLVLLTFFVISFLTNVLGPIVPDIISDFHVSLSAAGFLIFAFFIAYGFMSIPAGFLVERFTEKPVMVAAFVAAMLGSMSFALFPRYNVAVVTLFVIGAGMATLQVAINPLLRVTGGEEHFAFNEVLAQLLFGCAAFISPRRLYQPADLLVSGLEPGAQFAEFESAASDAATTHSHRVAMGFPILDIHRGCFRNGSFSQRLAISPRSAQCRRAARHIRDVWQPGAAPPCVGVFPCDFCICGLRTRNS
jgi:fucose permease